MPFPYRNRSRWASLVLALAGLAGSFALAPSCAGAASDAPAAAALGALVRPVEQPGPAAETAPLFLRGRHTFVILPDGGGAVAVRVRPPAPRPGVPPVYFRAIGADGKAVIHGECAPGKERVVELSATRRRALFVDFGESLASFQIRGARFGLMATPGSPARLGPGARRLHFLVPRGTKAFTLHARGLRAGAGAPLQAYTPAGRLAAEAAPGAGDETTLTATVNPEDAGGVWALSLESGANADAWVWLGSELPPFLAPSPDALALPFIHYTAGGALYLAAKSRSAPLQAAINVSPRDDRLARASMRRAGSSLDLWTTKPAPFTNGQVRIVLPPDMPAGTYDLSTALLDREIHVAATHRQRVVVRSSIAWLDAEKPLLRLLPPVPAAPFSLRARLALDPALAPELTAELAVIPDGEREPVVRLDLGHPESAEVAVPLPASVAPGVYRLEVSLRDGDGRALGSAAQRGYLAGGKVLLEEAPPAPAAKTALRATQKQRGYVLFCRDFHEALPYNYEPASADVGRPLSVWATPGEYEPATFGVYALKPLQEAKVQVSALARQGGGGKIDASRVDVRLVRFWPQRASADPGRFRVLPELLETASVANLPQARISQYWLTLHVPGNIPAGDYRGTVTFQTRGAPASSLKFLVKVLPFKLARPAGRTWCLYADSRRWEDYSEGEVEQELRDIKAHGIDSLVLSPLAHARLRYEKERLGVDLNPLARLMALYRKAGLRGPVIFDVRDLGEAIARARGGRAKSDDPGTRRLFTVVLSELAMRAAADGWPECLFQVGAVPGGPTSTTEGIRAEAEALRRAGLSTFALVSAPAAAEKEGGPLLDVRCYAPGALLGSPPQPPRDRGGAGGADHPASAKPYWAYGLASGPECAANEGNVLANRYLAGVAFRRSGAAGLWISALQRPVGEAYNDFDGEARDACLTYLTPNRQPLVPTIQWEGLREGIDDAAYLNTFTQMAARMMASPRERVSSYARQVEREAQELTRRIPWGVTPEGLSPRALHDLRIRLCKYMGTMLSKASSPDPAARSSRRRR